MEVWRWTGRARWRNGSISITWPRLCCSTGMVRSTAIRSPSTTVGAMRWVRAHADTYHLARDHIGIMGFSAGGHVASTVSTHFGPSTALGKDAIAKVSARPDFTILAYPVVTMKKDLTHMGSRENLLGQHPTGAMVELLSNETQVTDQTPSAFIYTTDADTTVPPENSVNYYLALHRHHVPAELHIFREGGHGSGLGQHDQSLSIWPALLARWMAGMGLMDFKHIQPPPAISTLPQG